MASYATQVKRRRGTEAQNNAFTGAEGEITVDLTNKTLRVHDGSTVGGTALAKDTQINDLYHEIALAALPVGSIMSFARVHEGWLACDGGELDIVDYQPLFADIGYLFSNGGYGWTGGGALYYTVEEEPEVGDSIFATDGTATTTVASISGDTITGANSVVYTRQAGQDKSTFNLPYVGEYTTLRQAGANARVGLSGHGAVPNITGTDCGMMKNVIWANYASGAFTQNNHGANTKSIGSGSNYGTYSSSFDASRCSGVYQNDRTAVWPAGLNVIFCIKY